MVTSESIGEEILPSTVKVYVGLLLSLIVIIGLASNLVEIFSVAFYRRLHDHVINIIITNAAVCSFLTDAICAPIVGIYVIKEWPRWPLSTTACNITTYVTETNSSVLTWTFVLMSVERYYATIKRKLIPKKVALACLAVIWIVSMCVHSTHTFRVTEKIKDISGKNMTICNQLGGNITNEEEDTIKITIIIINIVCVTLTFIPLLLTANHLRRLQKMKMPSSSKTFKVLKVEFKVVLIIICLCYAFSLPSWIISLLQTSKQIKAKVVILSRILSFLCTVIIPLSCFMFSKYFRNAVIDMFTGCKNSTLRLKQPHEADTMRKPLTAQQPLHYAEYEELNTPPKFIKGTFKTSSENNDMGNVSIGSHDFSPIHTSAKDNASYTGSNNDYSFIDTKF